MLKDGLVVLLYSIEPLANPLIVVVYLKGLILVVLCADKDPAVAYLCVK
jgi:hypothetical protein